MAIIHPHPHRPRESFFTIALAVAAICAIAFALFVMPKLEALITSEANATPPPVVQFTAAQAAENAQESRCGTNTTTLAKLHGVDSGDLEYLGETAISDPCLWQIAHSYNAFPLLGANAYIVTFIDGETGVMTGDNQKYDILRVTIRPIDAYRGSSNPDLRVLLKDPCGPNGLMSKVDREKSLDINLGCSPDVAVQAGPTMLKRWLSVDQTAPTLRTS